MVDMLALSPLTAVVLLYFQRMPKDGLAHDRCSWSSVGGFVRGSLCCSNRLVLVSTGPWLL